MQDSYEITLEEIQKAYKQGYSVMVIINGEWYELKTDKTDPPSLSAGVGFRK